MRQNTRDRYDRCTNIRDRYDRYGRPAVIRNRYMTVLRSWLQYPVSYEDVMSEESKKPQPDALCGKLNLRDTKHAKDTSPLLQVRSGPYSCHSLEPWATIARRLLW